MIGAQSKLPTLSSDEPHYSLSLPPTEEGESGGGFTVLQVWYMLYAHLRLSIGIFILLVGLAFLGIKALPKSYEATAALIVNADNTDPLAGRTYPIGQTSTFFPTQVELINNSVVLRPVVDRLQLRSDRQFTDGFTGDPKALDDVIVTKLRAALRVQPGAGSQLLYISATARDGVKAAAIANAVADEYLHQTSQRTNAPAIEKATRYSEQLASLKDKVDATQTKVAEFRQKYGMADLKDGQNGDSEGAALGDLQTKLLQAQNERRQLEGQQATPEIAALRAKLDQLEGEMGQLRTTLGLQHPRVLQKQSEIDATRNALSGNSAVQLDRARGLENKYQAAVTEERKRLLERRGLQDEGAKLLLEQKLAEENYAQALRGQDQVQFASVGNYKDVSVVSRAEPPVKATKPNKLKLLAAAIAVSLALAVGGPFAYELLLNRRIRCRDDLERHFHVVTLAQFERMNPAPTA